MSHFILPATNPRTPAAVARRLGLGADAISEGYRDNVGLTGAAHPLLMLQGVSRKARPGDYILMTAFDNGCDALLFRATERIAGFSPGSGVAGQLQRGIAEDNYPKYQAFNGLLVRDTGKRSEADKQTSLTALYRNRAFLTGFMADKCRACGTVQMPPGTFCVNPECGAAAGMDKVSMVYAGGEVKTWTADRLTFDPNPPAYFGMIEFENGARLMMDFTDVNARPVKAGARVTVHFRIKQLDEQRGFRKYFWKAIPTGEQGGETT